ncbi:MAG TPA: Crp/Fnr family transcriptional regulator, partial [Rhodanobacter sp.]|nr:Crp/Fnr family transcriptional regulator [Rhodanobacter sp.]
MFDTGDGPCNGLLAGLPAAEFDRLSPHLESTWLSRDQTLRDPDVVAHYVYFPIDCIVSLQATLINGASDEIAMVGNEGVVGAALILGNDHLSTRASVRQPGHALRAGVECMRREFRRSAPGYTALVRYFQSLVVQISQAA